MNNPNFIYEYKEKGFTVIRNVINKNLLEEASFHVDWLMKRYNYLQPEHLHHPLMLMDAFWVRFITDEAILRVVKAVLGNDIACFTSHYICKPPLVGQPVLWHQDGAYWDLLPMDALAVWIAIDDSTPETGCLQMIPGSHKAPIQKPIRENGFENLLYSKMDEQFVDVWKHKSGVENVILKKGDISIHHPNIIHCSGKNLSNKRRCGLDTGYISTTTKVTNKEAYLRPIMVSGESRDGVNRYSSWPLYDENETIPFREKDQWNKKAKAVNQKYLSENLLLGSSPIEETYKMIDRLKDGTVK